MFLGLQMVAVQRQKNDFCTEIVGRFDCNVLLGHEYSVKFDYADLKRKKGITFRK